MNFVITEIGLLKCKCILLVKVMQFIQIYK